MVGETVVPKKSTKRQGLKKVFSVPVGRLRSKIAAPGRNGSSSRSGSRSICHHKILLRNNRELARALSLEKERCRGMVSENLNLKALLHESKLEGHGLEKQLCESKQSNSVYRESVMNHLRDAVKHSVNLTESLKLAMAVNIAESKDTTQRNSASWCSTPTSVSQPQRQTVNPMVSGLTIRHPRISLKRVIVNSFKKVTDVNVVSTEEETTESGDVSQAMDEQHEERGGLSTCLEEDEVCSHDANPDASVSEEEESQDDSIRRRIVSFRGSSIEKDKNRSGLEVGEVNPLNGQAACQTVEYKCVEQKASQQNGILANSRLPNGLCLPDNLSKWKPVVALNDISKFLQNANSVNVHKLLFGIGDSVSSEIVAVVSPDASVNEKENYPKPANITESKDSLKQSCLSSRLGSQLSSDVSEANSGACVKTVSQPDTVTKSTISNNMAVVTVNLQRYEEDPLEGTSWMHLNLYSEKKQKKKGGIKMPSEEESRHTVSENQIQEGSENSMDNRKTCSDEFDIGDYDKTFKNCTLAQSTPVNCGKSNQSCHVMPTRDDSKSSSKSFGDSHSGDSVDSLDDSSSQGNNQSNDRLGENGLIVSRTDTKLIGGAFVTVRVKRLALSDLSPVSNLTGTCNEVFSNPTDQICDGQNTNHEPMDFLGFGPESVKQECTNLEQLKKNVMLFDSNGLDNEEIYRSRSSVSMCSSRDMCDSRGFDASEYCDASKSEGQRPRRRAAPKALKEPNLRKKLRRDTIGTKKRHRKTVKKCDKSECDK